MSRSLLIGVIGTLALVIGLSFFFYNRYIKVKYKAAIEAVPADAALILEASDMIACWQSFKANDVWKDIHTNEALSGLDAQMNTWDSILATDPDFKTMVADNKTVVSFHANKGRHVSLLWVVETRNQLSEEQLVSSLLKLTSTKLVKRLFDKEVVYDLVNMQQQPVFSVSVRENLLMVSTDGTLVEEAVRKLKYQLNNHSNGFDQARTLAGVSSNLNLYVNYQYLPDLLAVFQKEEHKQLFKHLQSFANWSVFDIQIQPNQLAIQGITYTDDSLFQWLDLFKTQNPIESTDGAYLPSQTAYSLSMHFSNYPQFYNDLTEYLQHAQLAEVYTQFADSIEAKYGLGLQDKLVSLIGNTAILGIAEHSSDDIHAHTFGFVQMQNVQLAETIFEKYQRALAQKGESDSTSFAYLNQTIYRAKFGNYFKLFFGKPFENLDNPFYAFTPNGMIMANRLEVIQQVLDAFANQQTLDQNPAYASFMESNSGTSNIRLWMAPGKCLSIPNGFANDTTISLISRLQYDIQKFECIQIQYANTGNSAFVTNVQFAFKPSFNEDTKMLWATQLDTAMMGKPHIVFNHETKQNCVLVQDSNSNLYFISNSGVILWRTKLSGRIISDVYTVETNGTGNWGYLFSTENQACLIGANGNNYYGYPIRFPGKATVGIQLYDVYEDSSYRFFVPLSNQKVMGYMLNSKPIVGWNPKTVASNWVTRISLVKHMNQPYIMATDARNQLQVIHMVSGKPFVSGITALPALAPFGLSVDSANTFIWVLDSTMHVLNYQIGADSLPIVQSTISFTDTPHTVYIKPQPTGYLALAHSKTGIYSVSSNNEKGYQLALPDSSTWKSAWLTDATQNTAIGYANRTNGKMYVLRTNGDLYQSMPLDGKSAFTIGDLLQNKSNCIVVQDINNKLRAYKLK
ncbi:MAG: DUF3352 domain-containing protein [Bacteroidia bacterium]|jgi:hypothetical protein|nr:DUF3352 domain-containing protein [Bacteroidia bacterium]